MDTKIISVINQKGGVGKTTTVLNVATALATISKKVLAVDFDPQGNMSSGFGINLGGGKIDTIYDVLTGKTNPVDAIASVGIANLEVLAADINLAGFEVEIADATNREYILLERLSKIKEKYNYIIIDCPPSLGFLTINSLVASDFILIPLQCEFFALEGLSHLLEVAERIKSNFNSNLRIGGILLTMYDRRNKLTEQVENDVRACLGDLVYKNVIPRNVKLAESTSFGTPAVIYDANCSGSLAYINFVEEMVKKYDGK
ncbi:MAG: AAA family ATPase [Rickettsiales bacterium]|jgi:chromosome partitioning protein|nr:AAA family ATPase [Rickettsiales bacterium]